MAEAEVEPPENKVLIITYYWPPSGGSGVQRWLKFVKYLPRFAWTPYVFTPENPAFGVRDESLIKDVPVEAEVLHFPIWEPYEVFTTISNFFGGKKKPVTPNDMLGGSSSLFQKISTWIRGNLFIPDPRIFWVRPSAKFLEDFIRDNKIKIIITTGPPHSVHLIGYRLKKKLPIKWYADFRDPWTNWGFLDTLHVGALARKFHRRLEANVLATADKVITITPFYVRQFEHLAQRRVQLLTNGYDDDDFAQFSCGRPSKFTIRHVGIVNEKCDPRPVLAAIERMLEGHSEMQQDLLVDFVGTVHQRIKNFVSGSKLLSSVVQFSDPIPHDALIKIYGQSSVLLLVLHGYKDAEGYMPGKLFEYMATGIPVLGVGPVQGDAARVLQTTKSGEMFGEENIGAMADFVWKNYTAWKKGELPQKPSEDVKQYSRIGVTEKLVALLD